jgi:drug/metabolite transporter (DMT)-like permease
MTTGDAPAAARLAPVAAEAAPTVDRVGVAAILAGTAIIAWSPILARWLDVGPVAGGAWRMTFALPIVGAWAFRNARATPGRNFPARAIIAMVFAGLFFAVDVGSFHTSIAGTSVANSTFIGNVSPLLAVAGGALFFDEHPSRVVWAALALALVGSWAMTGFAAPSAIGYGDAFALIAAIAYAGYMLSTKRARESIDGAGATFWSALCAAPVLFAAAAMKGETIVPSSARGWAVVATLGLVSHALGQGLTSVALGRAPVALVAVVVLAQPPVSTLLAWLVFGETMSAQQLVGGAIILIAVALGRPR